MTLRFIVRTGILSVAVLSLVACAINARFGAAPRIDRLASLKRGESTEADVLLALGEPLGRGMARLSASAAPRKVLQFELRQVQGGIGRQTVLLVFLEGERFDGYVWYASKELLDAKP